MALLLAVSAATTAFFTDRVGRSTRFTTASFSADGYKLTRTAPAGPFCAGENVTLTLKESNTGSEDVNSVISMKATWVSPDTGLSIFGNANAADNAKLSIDGTNVSYKVSADKKSITFDLPKHVLTKGTSNKARDLTLTSRSHSSPRDASTLPLKRWSWHKIRWDSQRNLTAPP